MATFQKIVIVGWKMEQIEVYFRYLNRVSSSWLDFEIGLGQKEAMKRKLERSGAF